MKHAVLIIAHKNIQQLIRLIRSLDHENIDVYVHLDRKWKLTEEEQRFIASATEHVFVLPQRISAFLDTWSLCEVTLLLMKQALESKTEYQYFLLLSGQDYPIKSKDYILNYLEQQYPRPMIDCTPLRKDNWIYSGFKWIRFHSYYRAVERISKNPRIRKLLLLPAYALQVLVTILLRSPYKRLQKANCDLYGGSAWWILPREIASLCVEEWKNNTPIIKAFKLKNTPEETFFQTMAMRSSLKDSIEINDPYAVLQNCMTYAYFFDETHPPTGHPYIFRAGNLEMLKNRKELFARKFDMDIDKNIFDMIDQTFKET